MKIVYHEVHVVKRILSKQNNKVYYAIIINITFRKVKKIMVDTICE